MGAKFTRRRYWAERAGDHIQHRRRRRWPWILLACVGVVIVLGAIGGIAGLQFLKQADSVRADLTAAKRDLSGVTNVVKSGDTASLEATSARVLALTAHADKTVQGPLWGIASHVPFVGQNVAAVRDATVAVHILARDAMPAAIQLLSTLNVKNLEVAGGGVNLAPFKAAVAVLPALNSAFKAAQAQVAGVDRASLLPIVDSSIGELLTIINEAAPAMDSLQKYLPTYLTMAGANGPRTYIVLFQNNAEIRATGGNPGAESIIRVDNGHVEMLDDANAAAFHNAGVSGQGSYRFPAATQALYEQDTTYYSQNYTRTPDFPTAAQMFQSLWRTSTGGSVDGVFAIDPVVLSAILQVTGPLTLEDGSQVTSANAVKMLLSDTYARFGRNGPAADAFFADVASRVFQKLSSGHWDPITMFQALQQQAENQRVYAWMAAPAEQAIMVDDHLDGALAATNSPMTQVGIYLNDSSHSKLEYYLKTAVNVTCDATARTVTTTLTMSSSAPTSGLGPYVIGLRDHRMGLPNSTMLLDALAFAAPGGKLTMNPASGDIKAWNRSGSEHGRDGKSITIALRSGQTKKVSYTTTLPSGPLGTLDVRFSPTVTDTPVTVDAGCDALFPVR